MHLNTAVEEIIGSTWICGCISNIILLLHIFFHVPQVPRHLHLFIGIPIYSNFNAQTNYSVADVWYIITGVKNWRMKEVLFS